MQTNNQRSKVYALHIGDTKVPYGQVYGGTEGWSGLQQAVWNFLTDKHRSIIVPIYAYPINHPDAGLILVDTGINWRQAHEHNTYYKSLLLRLTLDEDEYRLTREQSLTSHLARLGYQRKDIGTVILTHLHEDHLGELRSFSPARVVLSEDEWNAKHLGIFPLRNSPSAKDAITSPNLVSYTSGPFHSFSRRQDLLGDGSIMLLPTPGHTAGHLAVLVRMENAQLLLTGDTLYTLRHLAVDQVRPITLGKRAQQQQNASIRRIRRLRQALPETIVAPAHDHTAYGSAFLDPYLADGALSHREREAIKAYEAWLFDAAGRLTPDALPHYVPSSATPGVGTVAEPRFVREDSSDSRPALGHESGPHTGRPLAQVPRCEPVAQRTAPHVFPVDQSPEGERCPLCALVPSPAACSPASSASSN